MNFKQRIWLLPVMVTAIVGVGVAVNAHLSSTAASNLSRVDQVQYPLVEALRSLRNDHAQIQELLQQAVSEGDAAAIDRADERARAAHETLAQLEKLDHDSQTLATQLRGSFDTYVGSAKRASLVMLGKEAGDASSAIKSMQQDNATLDKALTENSEQTISAFKALLEESKSSVQNTLTVSMISALITMTVLGFGSWIVIGKVFSSLGGDPEEAVDVVRHIATGDFTRVIKVRSNDRDSLLANIALLQDKLGQLIRNIHESSASVDNAANEMNSAVNELSNRTSSQAASLEETASSMEQMTSTVKQNADNARQANQLAIDARKQAESGGEIVDKAIGAMAEINTSSKRIADIIGVIDEIAFQTNLLALNAAVEAARAGEQGRGFAVVASEVRNLAQRSATAAREIKNLIQDSVTKVQDGSSLVDASGKRLIEIVTSVKKVADIIGDISSASQEQARGLEQVNTTVNSLDEVTQQNSAMVNQASGVSDHVALQAKRLLDIVSVFRVSGITPQSAPVHSASHVHHAADDDWQQVA